MWVTWGTPALANRMGDCWGGVSAFCDGMGPAVSGAACVQRQSGACQRGAHAAREGSREGSREGRASGTRALDRNDEKTGKSMGPRNLSRIPARISARAPREGRTFQGKGGRRLHRLRGHTPMARRPRKRPSRAPHAGRNARPKARATNPLPPSCWQQLPPPSPPKEGCGCLWRHHHCAKDALDRGRLLVLLPSRSTQARRCIFREANT